MASEKELKKKLEKILQDLNPEDLTVLIKKLTEDYYLSFFSNNKEVNEASLNNLKQILKYYSADYNIAEYINYCFLLAVNGFLEKYVHNEIKLTPLKVFLTKKESEVNEAYSTDTLEMIKEVDEELAELYLNPSSTIHDRTDIILKAVDKQLEITEKNEKDNRLFKDELADYNLDKALDEVTYKEEKLPEEDVED